uniref:Uncharacterized protein n=1 Tax=Cucumis melo TaxID=3656 RepID=A0A9I9EM60_CUCME
MGFQYGRIRSNEGLIVHRSEKSLSVQTLAGFPRWAVLEIEAYGNEHSFVNCFRNITRVQGRIKATEFVGKCSGKGCILHIGEVFRRVVVWPGAIIMAVVLKGFVYAASISTTVNVWLAMAKKSSSLSAPLITLSRHHAQKHVAMSNVRATTVSLFAYIKLKSSNDRRSKAEWHKTSKEDAYEYDKQHHPTLLAEALHCHKKF